jgi:ubiquinone/menaquinone biosynthesis C-methylase UbiE
MEYTGERYLSRLDAPETCYEHWHRYLYSTLFCKDKVVLDVACGEGYGSYLLSKYSKKVVGIDIDYDVINFASREYINNNLEFIVGNVNNLPIKGKCIFDLIVSFETIEHINEKNQIKFLTEVKRLLKPGGVLIISTPNKSLYTDVLKNRNKFHVKEFYLNEFNDFLKKYFQNVKIMGQKIYSSSYIWDKDKNYGDFIEFELAYENNRLLPSKTEKKILYAVAVCSDEKLDEIQHSLLVDTSDRLTNVRDECIAQLQNKISKMENHYAAQLFIDTGKGTSEEQSMIREVSGKEEELEFDVSSYEGIAALRFDPLNDAVRLKLEEIVIIGDKNKGHQILEYTTNCSYRRDKDYTFETNDPIITFKVRDIDNAKKVIFRLKYILLGNEVSRYLVNLKQDEIAGRDEELRKIKAEVGHRDLAISTLKGKVYELESHYVAQLFIDTGKGISEEQSISKEISGKEEELEFDVSRCEGIEALRFDPLNDMVRLKLEGIVIIDDKNEGHQVLEYTTNCSYKRNKDYTFETNAPIISFKVRDIDNARKVIIRLKYILLGDEAKTYIITKKNEEISERLYELRLKEAELHEKDSSIEALNKEISSKEAELQERDSRIETLNKAVSEKEAELREKGLIIADLNKEINNKEAELQKEDSIIETLNEEKRQQLIKLESLQGQLETELLLKENILNSKSWKLTAPLRWIYNKVRK